MKARDWAFMACRLMGLWFGIHGLISLPYAISAVHQLNSADIATREMMETLLWASPLLMASGYIVIGAVLFLGARAFSAGLAIEETSPAQPLAPRTVFYIGLGLVGLFSTTVNLPSLVDGAVTLVRSDPSRRSAVEALIGNGVGVALGVAMVWVGVRRVWAEPFEEE